ncbi:Protein CBG27513 [Caenorhabditis briggsae]|uniref:Protein CBG27513 n=1 Tax=Caenorhabditis briggsae TaxID=6238 RepID=B6IF28_CAEBR|nr:Protein CBG27513 [Caenorhabditis briggsae]CAR98508.1 Protein CBG27513 [Caenorhabditis briggsae]
MCRRLAVPAAVLLEKLEHWLPEKITR